MSEMIEAVKVKTPASEWKVVKVYQKAPPHLYWKRPDGAYVAFERLKWAAIGYRECERGERPFQTLLAGAVIYEGWQKITAKEFEDMWTLCRGEYYDEKGNIRATSQPAHAATTAETRPDDEGIN